MGGWEGLVRLAASCGLLGVTLGFLAILTAASLGEHPVPLWLGKATAFFGLLGICLGVLLGLHAIWVSG